MKLLKRKKYTNFMQFWGDLFFAAKSKDDKKIHKVFSSKLACPGCKKAFVARDGLDLEEYQKSGFPKMKCPHCGHSMIEIDSGEVILLGKYKYLGYE